jgi:hypothetical protein
VAITGSTHFFKKTILGLQKVKDFTVVLGLVCKKQRIICYSKTFKHKIKPPKIKCQGANEKLCGIESQFALLQP